MPRREVLILAMTKMLAGICAAGVTQEADPIAGLRWVRPVREFGALLPGDMTDAQGRLVQVGDVVELNLLEPQPDPPHIEDYVTDFVRSRPRLLRRLEGQQYSRFFVRYLDRAPADVLISHSRSLCLVSPEDLSVRFSLDAFSGKYETRMSFVLGGDVNNPRATSSRGVSVTDLKWRALGRTWLGDGSRSLTLGYESLRDRLQVEAAYLTVGLSRKWQGEHWPLVVGVHTVPDYDVQIDADAL